MARPVRAMSSSIAAEAKAELRCRELAGVRGVRGVSSVFTKTGQLAWQWTQLKGMHIFSMTLTGMTERPTISSLDLSMLRLAYTDLTFVRATMHADNHRLDFLKCSYCDAPFTHPAV